MGNALLSGVSGMKAHQQMIDVAGNNLANLNTIGFKSGRITFSDLLSETIREASQPTSAVGGINPMQVGSGASVASIDKNMSQGTLINTGQALDMAIEGEGYFVLNDGTKNIFTRVGTFGVDSNYYLVDPVTGYMVQRQGVIGVADGFQTTGDNAIRIPYDVALPAKATTTISYNGNLSADKVSVSTHTLRLGSPFTISGAAAAGTTEIDKLDQFSGGELGVGETGTITITGAQRDGTDIGSVDLTVNPTTTLQDLLDELNLPALFGTDSTATLDNGELFLKDDTSGYSKANVNMVWSSATSKTLALPYHFQLETPGGNVTQDTTITVYDSLGTAHILNASFVRTDTARTWDLVIKDVSGDTKLADRRIESITFQTSGAYGGLGGSDTATFQLDFVTDGSGSRTITVDLGTEGKLDGLTQFGQDSTAGPSGQDGYTWGKLLSMSASIEGTLTGLFTNGIRKDIAQMTLAIFQNPSGLKSMGSNYYEPSANSGDPLYTKGASSGCGPIRGGMLESANVDVAEQFVQLIQAQNGFQANARTIRVSTEMLRELTNLIR